MANAISLTSAVDKDQLASGVAWLVLLEIQVVNDDGQTVTTLYVAHNNEDVVYKSQTYVAYPFEITVRAEAGAVPSVTLDAVDYEGVLTQHMKDYDGMTGSVVILRVVNSANLAGEPELEESFTVIGSSEKDFKINFSLGAENALRLAFPRSRQMRDRCRWRYKGVECAYAGALGTCDLTLDGPNGCEVHSNEANFGGFPGLVSRGVRVG